MHTHGQHGSSMDQRIFRLGLTVEETSLYLLCCGLVDAGKPLTTINLMEVWNSNENELAHGLKTLEKRHIITRILSDRQDKNVYQLTDPQTWKAK